MRHHPRRLRNDNDMRIDEYDLHVTRFWCFDGLIVHCNDIAFIDAPRFVETQRPVNRDLRSTESLPELRPRFTRDGDPQHG